MARNIIKSDYDYECGLIAIASSQKDYRLCWYLNELLGINLSKENDIEINFRKKKKLAYFPLYSFVVDEQVLEYFFFGNKSPGELLVPEYRAADFFLMIKSELHGELTKTILEKVKNLQAIQTAFAVDIMKLKSKEHLVF